MCKILAAWQQLPAIQVTQAMASLGFDWIVVDMEHSSITVQEAEAIFIATESLSKKPFVRLPSADIYLARRLLDAGAQGIIVPVVEDEKKITEFIQHCYFPPQGFRGLGLVRANQWGQNIQNYFHNFKPTIIAQIETKIGVSNIDQILKVVHLDGIMIGPFDLSASLGKPGQFDDPYFQNLCMEIFVKTKFVKKMIGFHQVETDLHKLKEICKKEYDFVAYGTDIVAMRHALQGIKN